jgi:uncharacterized protein YeaO (DUF488 family)
MNTDPWDDFVEVFAEELRAQAAWTPEMREAAREAYEKEQILSAQSEAAQEQLRKDYRHE